MEWINHYDNIKYAVSCGTTTCSVTVDVQTHEKGKCFAFKKMRDGGDFIMIYKDEWEKFLLFVNLTKTDKPCDES